MISPRLLGAAASGAVFFFLASTPVSAQVPFLDPLPWSVLESDGSARALLVQIDYFSDTDRDWSANRVGLTGLWPLGERTTAFVRDSYLSFDTGDRSAAQVWPEILAEDVSETWPWESRISGWGRIEIGLLSRLRAPLLGSVHVGLASGLPVGSDELYPLSAPSMPVRLLLRKQAMAGRTWRLDGGLGYLGHIDSSRDVLAPEAFPDGPTAHAELAWRPSKRRVCSLAWHGDFFPDLPSERLLLDYRQSWGETSAVGLTVQYEMGGSLARSCGTRVALTWYFFGAAEPDISGDVVSGD